jgi:dihydroneopterin aldolase / 2-amino-4-hydroxy-6-hydroxymethyldihydropteridine diphosphokinase
VTSPIRPVDLDVVPSEPVQAVLALGSNLGDRLATLQAGIDSLASEPGLRLLDVSPVVETAPVGGPEQDDYLNAVLLVACALSPRQLLAACHRAEAGQGRERVVRWGPRTLDVDVITFGALLSSDAELTLPHPRACERAFVLAPWAHVDPDAALPGPRGGPVALLAARADDVAGVRLRPDLVLRLSVRGPADQNEPLQNESHQNESHQNEPHQNEEARGR